VVPPSEFPLQLQKTLKKKWKKGKEKQEVRFLVKSYNSNSSYSPSKNTIRVYKYLPGFLEFSLEFLMH